MKKILVIFTLLAFLSINNFADEVKKYGCIHEYCDSLLQPGVTGNMMNFELMPAIKKAPVPKF